MSEKRTSLIQRIEEADEKVRTAIRDGVSTMGVVVLIEARERLTTKLEVRRERHRVTVARLRGHDVFVDIDERRSAGQKRRRDREQGRVQETADVTE
jgi:hypothetical protein